MLLCADVFDKYFHYVKGLAFEQEPNYDQLRKVFKEELISRKEELAGVDWVVLEKRERPGHFYN